MGLDRARLKSDARNTDSDEMDPSTVAQQVTPSGVGHSHVAESEAAGREAVQRGARRPPPTADDLVILFTERRLRRRGAVRAPPSRRRRPPASSAAPARAASRTRSRSRAAASPRSWRPTSASFGLCHLERDDDDIAGSARRAAEQARDRAGDRYAQLRSAPADRRHDSRPARDRARRLRGHDRGGPVRRRRGRRQPDLGRHSHVRRRPRPRATASSPSGSTPRARWASASTTAGGPPASRCS